MARNVRALVPSLSGTFEFVNFKHPWAMLISLISIAVACDTVNGQETLKLVLSIYKKCFTYTVFLTFIDT